MKSIRYFLIIFYFLMANFCICNIENQDDNYFFYADIAIDNPRDLVKFLIAAQQNAGADVFNEAFYFAQDPKRDKEIHFHIMGCVTSS